MDVLYYADGLNTTISVDRAGGYLYYRSNGKTDASTHPHDLAVQVLIGQVPMLLHPEPRDADVFVLGLGTGASAAAAARYPVRSIDVFDIESRSRGPVALFEAVNHGILKDPRVRFVVADGRNALLARPATYDVVIADPSDLWVAGVGNLFTEEFYRLVKCRLKPGGVFAQWLHTHSLTVEELRILAATLRAVFPDASLWRLSRADILLVGREAVPLPFETIRRKLEVPEVAEDLRSIGIWSPAAFFSSYLLGGDDLARLAGGARPHRDDAPVIEFRTPRQLYLDNVEATDQALRRLQTRPFPPLLAGLDEESLSPLDRYLLGFGYASLERGDAAIAMMENAVAGEPGNTKFRIGLANQYEAAGRPADAADSLRAALATSPDDEEAALGFARVAPPLGRADEAEAVLRAARARGSASPSVVAALGALLQDAGRTAEALPVLAEAARSAPTDFGLRLRLARALVDDRRVPEALDQLKAAAGLVPNEADSWTSMGDALLQAGARADAEFAYRKALALDPASGEARAALRDLVGP
jgi:tetratricopeptide (TPR) repeat protein